MNKLVVAGVSGFIGAALSALYLYEWQLQVDLVQSVYALGVVSMAVGALANVAYWYGFSIVGTRHHNTTLHYMALLALLISVLTDASGAFFTLLPQYAASSGWEVFGLFMGALFAVAFIVTGLAVQKLRSVFGDVAMWYGIFAMISGVLALTGHLGSAYIYAFSMALNIILYILGGMILLQAAKK